MCISKYVPLSHLFSSASLSICLCVRSTSFVRLSAIINPGCEIFQHDLVDHFVFESPVWVFVYLLFYSFVQIAVKRPDKKDRKKSRFLFLSHSLPSFLASSPSQPCHTAHDLFCSKTLLNYSMHLGWIQITVLIFKSLFLAKGSPSLTVSVSFSLLELLTPRSSSVSLLLPLSLTHHPSLFFCQLPHLSGCKTLWWAKNKPSPLSLPLLLWSTTLEICRGL